MKQATTPRRRPLPPDWLGLMQDGYNWPRNFAPAPDVRDWMIDTFIDEAGALFNEDHKHLAAADFEVLWASAPFAKQGRVVLGQTELVAFRAGGWQKLRQEQQMCDWFGRVPEYLITLAGSFALECQDADWCALVEHELYHIGHKEDEFGTPAWTKDGLPKLYIRGHDVEEFVGVVKRYGTGHPGGQLSELVKAGNAKPSMSGYQLASACGTCMLRAA